MTLYPKCFSAEPVRQLGIAVFGRKAWAFLSMRGFRTRLGIIASVMALADRFLGAYGIL